MDMFVLVINKLTITETRVIYGTYGIYRPVCYRMHILSVTGQPYNMLHTVLIQGGINNNNNKLPLYGSYKRYD